MALRIVKSSSKDIKRLMEIYEAAIKFMRKCGNMHQWGNGYPSEEIILNDIKNGVSFSVIDDNNNIVGVFSMIPGEDPTYKVIDGEWVDDELPYVTIHRIASDGSHKGVAKAAFNFAKRASDSVRIDTHEDNVVMRELVINNGFKYCGVIRLTSGDPRLAYQYFNNRL